MRTMMLALSTAAMVVTTTMILPVSQAEARKHYRDGNRNYRYSEFRGRDGRYHCRRPDGTVGTIIGGVGGALIGRSIDTRGDRTTGTVIGAAGGALLGNQIAKGSGGRRCR